MFVSSQYWPAPHVLSPQANDPPSPARASLPPSPPHGPGVHAPPPRSQKGSGARHGAPAGQQSNCPFVQPSGKPPGQTPPPAPSPPADPSPPLDPASVVGLELDPPHAASETRPKQPKRPTVPRYRKSRMARGYCLTRALSSSSHRRPARDGERAADQIVIGHAAGRHLIGRDEIERAIDPDLVDDRLVVQQAKARPKTTAAVVPVQRRTPSGVNGGSATAQSTCATSRAQSAWPERSTFRWRTFLIRPLTRSSTRRDRGTSACTCPGRCLRCGLARSRRRHRRERFRPGERARTCGSARGRRPRRRARARSTS